MWFFFAMLVTFGHFFHALDTPGGIISHHRQIGAVSVPATIVAQVERIGQLS
jgi:hypothetical protein